MAAPLGKPLLPPTRDGRISGIDRRVTSLERRGNTRWVYVSGVDAAGDQTGIDAPTWVEYDSSMNALPLTFGWQTPWIDAGGTDHQQDGMTRYRIGRSGLEMVINATGGVLGTAMFTLIGGYWDFRDGKQTFTATDTDGNFTCYTIIPRTDYPQCADVYSGRL